MGTHYQHDAEYQPFQRSSTEERPAVNRIVAGSSPAAGAMSDDKSDLHEVSGGNSRRREANSLGKTELKHTLS